MADKNLLQLLKEGPEAWNKWREENPNVKIDLKRADLSEANLGANLSDDLLSFALRFNNMPFLPFLPKDVVRFNLAGANLEGAYLTRAILLGANLSKAALSYANLSGTNLIGVNLAGANLEGAYLTRAILLGANLSKAALSYANLFEADLTRANLEGAYIIKADLSYATLSEADLSGTYLTQANLSYAKLLGAFLSEATLVETKLIGATLVGAHLQGARLSKVIGKEADFSKADLTRAELSGNLSGVNLSEAHLNYANLRLANLTGATLIKANLPSATLLETWLIGANLLEANFERADLTKATLSGANFTGANLQYASFIENEIGQATFNGCRIYGISAWGLQGDPKEQTSLIITPDNEAAVYVDDLQVAQFVYLLLNRENLRKVINTTSSKAVLILGRFTPERKIILDAIADELRKNSLLPIIFDFERPTDRDFTETIKTLAGISCFVIADITKPKSIPLELQGIIPDYQIPFVPIIQQGEDPFSMLSDLVGKYDWVLQPVREYSTVDELLPVFEKAIIEPAWNKRKELQEKKTQKVKTQSISDYVKETQGNL